MTFVERPPEPTIKVVVVRMLDGRILEGTPLPADEADRLAAEIGAQRFGGGTRETIAGPIPATFEVSPGVGGFVKDIEAVTTQGVT